MRAQAAILRLVASNAGINQRLRSCGRDQQSIEKANQQTSALQQEIWSQVTVIVRQRPDAVTAALMSAVNETFDTGTSERLALDTRLPAQIFWLLIGVMMLSMATLGYQFGIKGQPVRFLVLLLTLVWTAVVIDILDLATARLGSFRTDVHMYEWTRQGLGEARPPPVPIQ
ncbi:hypothetical protein FHT77_001017 [Rhizobium sp. BK181]|uniref:hypothetical protein n=1 Tax=Rhizobium sp. BK181 TaxID=2587072 RepID=UPI00160F97DB|nr:hypothetical protein [Rhizobium sp. BK181]MBB3315175.1 hypothetical protein [Rhizobium sp. BK181]